MFKIQIIDIIMFIFLIVIIIGSIVLRSILKRKLKDIEGDSEIYTMQDEFDVWEVKEVDYKKVNQKKRSEGK